MMTYDSTFQFHVTSNQGKQPDKNAAIKEFRWPPDPAKDLT